LIPLIVLNLSQTFVPVTINKFRLTEDIFILAIESSCDDTAAAVLHNDKVLSNVVANQEIHRAYGGVVPELASRAHQQNIVPVVDQALQRANIDKNQLSAIAFTQGPGLMGSLLVGTSFAKSLSLGLNIPLINVHHMHAHILAHFIQDPDQKIPHFPFIALTISGGHTQIVLVRDYFDMEILGETIDDAVGEAYDKSAKMLGLPYPGGPLIDRYAKEGNPEAYAFPKPKVDPLNFSFSGLKTAILYFLEQQQAEDPNFLSRAMNDVCASIQKTIVDYLMEKLANAVAQTGVNRIAIGGGVSANSGIRAALAKAEVDLGWQTYVPKFAYCTDNAAMIGIVGYLKYLEGHQANHGVAAKSRLSF
jgi:N6-L-threonylcarbamoyladenine synthase